MPIGNPKSRSCYETLNLNCITKSKTEGTSRNVSLSCVTSFPGSQLLFFTYFRQIIKARERGILSDGMETIEDVDWKKFPLIVGQPGSGKTFTVERCIEHAIHTDLAVCVVLPTGVLACRYRAKYEASITCDTVHSLFISSHIIPQLRKYTGCCLNMMGSSLMKSHRLQ